LMASKRAREGQWYERCSCQFTFHFQGSLCRCDHYRQGFVLPPGQYWKAWNDWYAGLFKEGETVFLRYWKSPQNNVSVPPIEYEVQYVQLLCSPLVHLSITWLVFTSKLRASSTCSIKTFFVCRCKLIRASPSVLTSGIYICDRLCINHPFTANYNFSVRAKIAQRSPFGGFWVYVTGSIYGL